MTGSNFKQDQNSKKVENNTNFVSHHKNKTKNNKKQKMQMFSATTYLKQPKDTTLTIKWKKSDKLTCDYYYYASCHISYISLSFEKGTCTGNLQRFAVSN